MSSVLRRAAWLFLALLFIVTGLGVGVVAFWQATHPAKDDSQTQNVTCAKDLTLQFDVAPAKDKLAGAKLADFKPLEHIDSLSCIDAKVGNSGLAVSSSSTIVANYTGVLAANGVIFQSSLDNGGQPFTAALSGGLIQGWKEGLLGMKAGGERRLLIPAALAYGAAGSCQTPDPKDTTKCAAYAIPPNADLVFDISIIAVQ